MTPFGDANFSYFWKLRGRFLANQSWQHCQKGAIFVIVYFVCLIKNILFILFQEPRIKLNRQNSLSMSNLATETEKICSQEIACSLPTYSYNRSYETLLRRRRNRSGRSNSIESFNSSVNSEKSIQFMKNPNIPLKVHTDCANCNFKLVSSQQPFCYLGKWLYYTIIISSCRLDKKNYTMAQIIQ